MFKCQNCGKQVQSGQPINKIIIETRTTTYFNIAESHKIARRYGVMVGDTWETEGLQVEKEINVCPDCCIKLTGNKPILKIEKPPAKTKNSRGWDSKNQKPYNTYKRTEPKYQSKRPQVETLSNIKK